MMRIGIFGGTFDPPHAGHKKYADELKVRLSLDKLIVIPTSTPPHKEKVNSASAEDRLNMVKRKSRLQKFRRWVMSSSLHTQKKNS